MYITWHWTLHNAFIVYFQHLEIHCSNWNSQVLKCYMFNLLGLNLNIAKPWDALLRRKKGMFKEMKVRWKLLCKLHHKYYVPLFVPFFTKMLIYLACSLDRTSKFLKVLMFVCCLFKIKVWCQCIMPLSSIVLNFLVDCQWYREWMFYHYNNDFVGIWLCENTALFGDKHISGSHES